MKNFIRGWILQFLWTVRMKLGDRSGHNFDGYSRTSDEIFVYSHRIEISFKSNYFQKIFEFIFSFAILYHFNECFNFGRFFFTSFSKMYHFSTYIHDVWNGCSVVWNQITDIILLNKENTIHILNEINVNLCID
jgi:hypothetical protein